ncbi:MAG: membrane protein insertion efficiency factor YidD [Elusimicrobiaceae bacterium]|nr:membrane protein insertion efficiency factor YidD [Elusimicrobiaceae bacterium]MBT3954561.1 membrane protein insertion efficiency factor YidD [Elusimicrobiaceae bacterium]MBT4007866.1 membrane protein insertion efficiency factor YidD [Elusimicrobiaceae bacterium]MBT4439719.1 membrane protein insertion efficiency factor YidD [Elusimicrobiaceae bacterium]MBT5986968.1 membrane protein insertion efficiency factor YidD [Elusimicrobiaceae bacterium]
MKAFFIKGMFKTLKLMRPLIGPANVCRFQPTCLSYSEQAFMKHGIFKGLILSIKRVAKCHPFHPGGVDTVK